jgi:hypothetical protein
VFFVGFLHLTFMGICFFSRPPPPPQKKLQFKKNDTVRGTAVGTNHQRGYLLSLVYIKSSYLILSLGPSPLW